MHCDSFTAAPLLWMCGSGQQPATSSLHNTPQKPSLSVLHAPTPTLTCPSRCCSSSPALSSTTSQSAGPCGSTTTAAAAATPGSTSSNTSTPEGSCRAVARWAGSSRVAGEVEAAPDQATYRGLGLRPAAAAAGVVLPLLKGLRTAAAVAAAGGGLYTQAAGGRVTGGCVRQPKVVTWGGGRLQSSCAEVLGSCWDTTEAWPAADSHNRPATSRATRLLRQLLEQSVLMRAA